MKSLTLEGVSLTLKDVNLTLPSQKRDKEREIARDKVAMSMDQRLTEIHTKITDLQEITSCLACPPDNVIISNNLKGKATRFDLIARSCLKTAPKTLFRHSGKVTHHIGPVSTKYMIARASMQQAEIRNLDSGKLVQTLQIQGLNCSLEHQERIYCGTQMK